MSKKEATSYKLVRLLEGFNWNICKRIRWRLLKDAIKKDDAKKRNDHLYWQENLSNFLDLMSEK